MYSDLGDPVKGIEYMRTTLDGEKNPHTRRCCSGRPPTCTSEYDFYKSLMFTPILVEYCKLLGKPSSVKFEIVDI